MQKIVITAYNRDEGAPVTEQEVCTVLDDLDLSDVNVQIIDMED